MSHKIDDLRKHLFETLDALKDKDKPMELDRARAVADVAKVIVESAKVEVDFLKVTGATRSTGFLPENDVAPAAPRVANGPRPVGQIEGTVCVLCRCKLTTAYHVERGLCGSCSDRPEAQRLKPAVSGQR